MKIILLVWLCCYSFYPRSIAQFIDKFFAGICTFPFPISQQIYFFDLNINHRHIGIVLAIFGAAGYFGCLPSRLHHAAQIFAPHSGEHATSCQLNAFAPFLALLQASYSLPQTRHVLFLEFFRQCLPHLHRKWCKSTEHPEHRRHRQRASLKGMYLFLCVNWSMQHPFVRRFSWMYSVLCIILLQTVLHSDTPCSIVSQCFSRKKGTLLRECPSFYIAVICILFLCEHPSDSFSLPLWS